MCKRSSKYFPIALYLLVFMCVVNGSSAVRAEKEFKNVEKGFSFTIPDGWMEGSPNGAEKDAAASIYFPGKYFKEFLWVSVTGIPVNAEEEFQMDAFPERFQGNLKKSASSLQFSKPERTEVAGSKGWKLSSEANRLGSLYRTKMWLVIHRHQLYCITWTDNPDKSHPEDVNRIISSFKFTLGENASEEYRNPDKGYSFTIASGWFKADRNKIGRADVGVYFPSEGVLEKFDIGVELAHEQQKIDFPQEIYGVRMKQFVQKSIPGAVFDPSRRGTVGGMPAWIFKFKNNIDGLEIQTTVWQVLVGNHIYNIGWTVPPGKSHPDAIEEMLGSVKFTSVSSNDLGQIEGQNYKNIDKGFSFTIPQGWVRGNSADAGQAVVVFFAPGGSRSNLNVVVSAIQDHQMKGFSDDSYPTHVQKDIEKAIPDAQFQAGQRSTIGGKPAWKFGLERKENGLVIRSIIWQVIDHGRIYTITYTDTQDESVPKQVDEIIDSFRFITR